MRILITGGFGFIGGRVGQHLQEAGHQVVLGSRKASGSPDWLPQAKVVQIDWDDSCALEQICKGVDVVIQAAGMNAQDCAADPVAALEFNGLSTARLLEAAIHEGVKRFIYLSTAHVYANPLIGSITEGNCPRNMHPYATSHLAGENAILGARQRGQIEGMVLRLSNAFGAPAYKEVNCWMLLVNDLCRQAILERKLVLRSSGLQQRDFIAMQNVARALSHLLELNITHHENTLFNLGGDGSLSVWAMAQKIAERCQKTLGYLPLLERVAPHSDDKSEELNFSSVKLQDTGFMLEGGLEGEIDRTLLFCNEVWGAV